MHQANSKSVQRLPSTRLLVWEQWILVSAFIWTFLCRNVHCSDHQRPAGFTDCGATCIRWTMTRASLSVPLTLALRTSTEPYKRLCCAYVCLREKTTPPGCHCWHLTHCVGFECRMIFIVTIIRHWLRGCLVDWAVIHKLILRDFMFNACFLNSCFK